MAVIELRDGDNLDMALKKFKRLVQRENILREFKQHAYYLRPGERDRIKRSVAQRRRHKRGLGRFFSFEERPSRVTRRTDLPAIAYEPIPTAQEVMDAAAGNGGASPEAPSVNPRTPETAVAETRPAVQAG